MTAMSDAAPKARARKRSRETSELGRWMELFLTTVLGAIIAALFTYYFTQKLNRESAVQQQYEASVQDFSATGARVDAAITNLGDATVDQEGVDAAKREARQAIAAHAASTLALRPIIGKGNVEAYMVGIADLRKLVDSTGDVPAAARASKGRFALIDNRNKVIEDARRNIYR